MTKFAANQFVPTEWSTAEEKAKFANHFFRFLEKGCPVSLFHKWFYTRLSMTFGHMAHYNRGGFFDVWFSSPERKLAFIHHTMQHPCYGDPKHTYSDVEKEIILRLATSKAPDQIAKKPLVDPACGKVIAFVVCRRSENRNAFGLRGYWLMNKAGQVYEAARCNDLEVFQTVFIPIGIDGSLSWGTLEFEVPTRKKDAPPGVVAEVFAEADKLAAARVAVKA